MNKSSDCLDTVSDDFGDSIVVYAYEYDNGDQPDIGIDFRDCTGDLGGNVLLNKAQVLKLVSALTEWLAEQGEGN